MSGDRYVLDSAGVRTLNATIARVRNLPGNPLNLNSRHRQVMTEAIGGSNEYNGYFKIIDASTYNEDGTLSEAKIKIVDGATYDEETGTSGDSRCRVNNVTYYISTYTSDSLSGDSVFALKYTPKVYADSSTGTEFQPDKVEIVNLTSEGIEGLPDDTAEACWYQLGRVFISNGRVEIQQDHQSMAGNGIPQIFWFDLCEG